MLKVKICGLTGIEDARKAEDLGADFLGFVFFEKSPRAISPDLASEIISQLHGSSQRVGLFLDQDIQYVKNVAEQCRLDIVQLHGDEPPSYVGDLQKGLKVIKSFKMKKGFDFTVLDGYNMADFFLFDSYRKGIPGGTGVTFDWSLLSGQCFDKPIFLAGGLKPDNVKLAVQTVRPYAVDVASGVESSPGRKDHILLEEFIHAAR